MNIFSSLKLVFKKIFDAQSGSPNVQFFSNDYILLLELNWQFQLTLEVKIKATMKRWNTVRRVSQNSVLPSYPSFPSAMELTKRVVPLVLNALGPGHLASKK